MKKIFSTYLHTIFVVVPAIICLSCQVAYQSMLDTEQNSRAAASAEKSNPEALAAVGTINFSGYSWFARSSNGFSGPGLNIFSSGKDNVWLDSQGQLHLRIVKSKGKWQCAEIFSEKNFGYGEYVFTLASPAEKIDKNVVLGLFTWDDNTFRSDGNSEIDIEFAKWGNARLAPLQFSVQPTNWGEFSDRFYTAKNFSPKEKFSTHYFRWAPDEVNFKSYYGEEISEEKLAASWNFYTAALARSKSEGGRTSDPVVIPKPGSTTKVHLNLWLHDANGDGFGDAPSDGQPVEIIIRKFQHRPLGSGTLADDIQK